jgi:hypothetical protein
MNPTIPYQILKPLTLLLCIVPEDPPPNSIFPSKPPVFTTATSLSIVPEDPPPNSIFPSKPPVLVMLIERKDMAGIPHNYRASRPCLRRPRRCVLSERIRRATQFSRFYARHSVCVFSFPSANSACC